ncbi:MAG TPA: 50S ribosomal protein L10 [Dehalococcoidales bacterium]|nr:50S ribosomal protein L10 [Dehalococcoidales bacterium]
MPTEKKEKIIKGLRDVFSRCSVGILTDYRGLTTAELSNLRRRLREAGIEYHVVKNSLAQLAAREVGLDEAAGSFVGPVAVAIGYGEIPEAAKVLTDYIRTTKSILIIKGGFLTDRVLTPRDVESLARLPSREVLIGRVLAGMQSPIYGLVNVLAGPVRGIMGVLQARIRQLEGQ